MIQLWYDTWWSQNQLSSNFSPVTQLLLLHTKAFLVRLHCPLCWLNHIKESSVYLSTISTTYKSGCTQAMLLFRYFLCFQNQVTYVVKIQISRSFPVPTGWEMVARAVNQKFHVHLGCLYIISGLKIIAIELLTISKNNPLILKYTTKLSTQSVYI